MAVVNKENSCPGLFFRGRKREFITRDYQYVYQKRMVFLKRKSCPGCEKCEPLHDALQEFVSLGDHVKINKLEDGGLYQLRIANIQKDWETGVTEDYDLEFVQVKEK